MFIFLVIIIIFYFLYKNSTKSIVSKIENKLLKQVVLESLSKYNYRSGLPIKLVIKRSVMFLIFACVTILDLFYIFLYHDHLFIAFIIEIINIIITFKVIKQVNIKGEIIKQIKASPNDNMDYIAAGIIQNVDRTKTMLSNIFGLLLIVASFLIPFYVFQEPHMIYEKDGDNYAVRYYSLSLKNVSSVEIPDTYNGRDVIGIRGNVFKNLNYITSLKLPSNLEYIRGHAFENTGIIGISLPGTLNYIGGYAFANSELERIEIPDTVLEIGGGSFSNCRKLSYVKLPKYITEIHGNTFEYTNLKSVEIPNGVTRIGGHAFHGCTNLSEVIVPGTVSEIGSSAFRECYSLYNISIPASTYINERSFKDSPTSINRY